MKNFARSVVFAFLVVFSLQSNATGVKWGFSERQGSRPTMEDAHIHVKLGLPGGAEYFGIFDGHGGSRSAKLAAKIAPALFFNSYKDNHIPDQNLLIHRAFEQSYVELDKEMQAEFPDGTTALSALIWDDELYFAWAGDTRAVLVAGGKVSLATTDHKPNAPAEKKRIEAAGEVIWAHPQAPTLFRVGKPPKAGNLSLSRSLGDKPYKDRVKKLPDQPNIYPKPSWVEAIDEADEAAATLGNMVPNKGNPIIPYPETLNGVKVKKGDIIIIACDGIWDVMKNEEVAHFVTDNMRKSTAEIEKVSFLGLQANEFANHDGDDTKLTEIARALRDEALRRRSGDNISVMIVELQ
jgi:protein phosphatase 2C family protein 2/3